MAKTIKLLLTENVDNLGIVGDVVSVRAGYARNYLLPRGLATEPSEEAIEAVAQRRAEAERMMAELRKKREEMVQKLDGLEVTIQRSCNDQGILYGAVTQQDIASALGILGYEIKPRDVRIPQTIKRVDTYEVAIKFDQELGAAIKLWVVPDRKLDSDDEREEMDFDNEGNLIEKPRRQKAPARPEAAEEPAEA
jgi:large subunit ribosomal protein L9